MTKSHTHHRHAAERMLQDGRQTDWIGWHYVASMLVLYSVFAALVLWTMFR